jgi:hypothetical protein
MQNEAIILKQNQILLYATSPFSTKQYVANIRHD